MEFLRFGGRINGSYWGCCAVDIIQNFAVDPDDKTSSQFVYGDSGIAAGENLYLGKTYHEVFLSRLRAGTHSPSDKQCRGFLAILTATQCQSATGKKWLKILKENGFEFIRAIHNSVYGERSSHPNYIFGLFRNIGNAAIKDPLQPPAGWNELPEPLSQQELWDKGKTVYYTEAELRKDGVPVMSSGKAGYAPKPKGLEGEVPKPFYDPYHPETYYDECRAYQAYQLAKNKPQSQPQPKAKPEPQLTEPVVLE